MLENCYNNQKLRLKSCLRWNRPPSSGRIWRAGTWWTRLRTTTFVPRWLPMSSLRSASSPDLALAVSTQFLSLFSGFISYYVVNWVVDSEVVQTTIQNFSMFKEMLCRVTFWLWELNTTMLWVSSIHPSASLTLDYWLRCQWQYQLAFQWFYLNDKFSLLGRLLRNDVFCLSTMWFDNVLLGASPSDCHNLKALRRLES
jgi:hypothetical protein